MVPWSSPGDVLRWWRTDVLGFSQQQVAARLSVQSTALSNWENGARAISIDINHIDRCLDADGLLAGLLWSFWTPKGLDADRLWTKVYPGDSTPVWVWIRSEADEVRFEGEWGIARVDKDLELGPNGLFMTVAASLPDSPIVVHLSEPGWADFGRGEIPDEMPGAPVMAAIDHASRSGGSGTFYELFFGNLADRFSRSRSRDLAKLNRSAPRSLASFFSAFTKSGAECMSPAWPPLPTRPDPTDRLRYARLRRARHLSLVEAATRLADLTGIDVSKDTLRRFETDIGDPHDRLLPAALDQMLGANGHLATVELRSDQGSGAVRFPHYWYGPVWFEFTEPDPTGEIRLDSQMPKPEREVTITIQWGEWSREVTETLPMLLSYFHSEAGVPLRINASPDVAWKVGLGRRPGGTPISYGWSPTSVDVVQRAISETERVLIASLEQGRRTRDESDLPPA